ncbi:MAG TPA: hypothetical protein H9873_05800 [Candidatus Dorea gallistercoris]|uniref:Uncharacterized protein n=1 Tax=Candidatus Dorea gallistercoris TaxID=2838542 RepID=A0A9D1UDG7_9FIRM|nr:hypothetical protein [Candidatus Dorea gallistercoris]
MTSEAKVDRLIELLKREKPGYGVLQEPEDYQEKRRFLRSLMNVRWPRETGEEYLRLQEEIEDKGIVTPRTCRRQKNAVRRQSCATQTGSLPDRGYYHFGGRRYS